MSKAAISIIKGGLGNQLFIYSAGMAFARRTGREHYLDVKRGYTNDNYDRHYRLDHFPITSEIMPEQWRVAPSLKHLRHKLIRAWNKYLPQDKRSYIAQQWDQPATQLTKLEPTAQRVTLNGYWQDEAYFSDYEADVRRELAPPPPSDARNLELGEQFASSDTVMVHARRIRYPVLLPADYYKQAIKMIRKRIPHPRFVVFSDDPDWTKDNIDFGGDPAQWVEHNTTDEMADLWLMKQCRHAVIANSSFSWWGAWLGGPPSAERVIISPDRADWNIRPANGWDCIAIED